MAIVRVKFIPLAQAMPGMVLEKDVCNSLGQVLLKAGIALSEASIASLAQKNIRHVRVLHEDHRSEQELADERTKLAGHINSMFRNAPQDGIMGALRQIILDHRLGQLSS